MGDLPRIAILVNSGDSGVLAPRARAFASGLGSLFRVEIFWRRSNRIRSVFQLLSRLRRFRPALIYQMDLGYSLTIASRLYSMGTGCALVVETGDPLAELLRGTERVGRLGYIGVRMYERAALQWADRVVVRGTGLKAYLAALGIGRVEIIPDGVDTCAFHPMRSDDLRRDLRVTGFTTIGVLGTLNWSSRLEWGYGRELVEAIARLEGLPVVGIVVGDGPGRRYLEELASKLHVKDRVKFVGRIPHENLCQYINAMDICLSTQTNDWVGQSRTTAKLPLFLACGRFVLASRVGEAARVLPETMLVHYAQGFDTTYPERLGRRIAAVLREREGLEPRDTIRGIAKREFDYGILTQKLALVLQTVLHSRR